MYQAGLLDAAFSAYPDTAQEVVYLKGLTWVAVARKLAVVLHRMWRDQTAFRFGKEPGGGAGLAAA